ncbi:MAG: hypothetical protein CSA95_06885 [Bacteroidetes bacterium]|nr:MAG: hypothetical protein CSA95_06885 [Bacteroidota bacterium]PIE88516.1 MAG: hypothetical protein CSA04_01610 [Bacteroidota bacterium]
MNRFVKFSALSWLLLFFLLLSFPGRSQQQQPARFLSHSVGHAVFQEGGVEAIIDAYNTTHGTSFQVEHVYYPDYPYEWDNYPYDYWNLWVNGACDSGEPYIECLDTMLERYGIIIYKHCYPGAGIGVDPEVPDISSPYKCLANYKLQYRALREKMDAFPHKKFIVWTLAPLHRLATYPEEALRARQFVNWVKDEWLFEDGQPHPNIYIFDFFNIVAESDLNPSQGEVNCLKYEYEQSHNGDDSHPNTAANLVAGEEFANFIIEVFNDGGTGGIEGKDKKGVTLVYDSGLKMISLRGDCKEKGQLFVVDMMGRVQLQCPRASGSMPVDASHLTQGIHLVVYFNSEGQQWVEKIRVE